MLFGLLAPLCAGGPVPQADGQLRRLNSEIVAVEQLRSNSLAFLTNYPLARLAAKKAALALKGGAFLGRETIQEIIDSGFKALERLRAGQAYRARPGKLTELAYEADNDGSVQPYYLYLPPDYDESRSWPLIVFLHGYVPTITVLDPWILPEEVCQIAGENGCMLLIPYGRRNTDFQGVGEVDVLQTIALVCSQYRVDRRRIYMCGVSMGGMGAWNMALRHPGMFAATTPIAGHTDMLKWWGWPADKVPPFKKWLIEWDNPIDLVINARGQHFFVQHGENDALIPAEQSRSIVAAAARLGIPIAYYEHKGSDHYIYWRTECFERAWSWQKQFSLRVPKKIDFKTYSLEYDTAFWARIVRIRRWGLPAEIHVNAEGERIEVKCENVDAFALDLGDAPHKPNAQVVVKGQVVPPKGKRGRWTIFELAPLPQKAGFPPPKRKGLCGPVEEVFDTPFIVVQGTAGDEREDEKLARKVGRWATEWDAFADGYPRVATDVELTKEQIDKFNLVLFGTPQTNSILGKIADRLPIRIADHSYTIAGRTFEGSNLGLIFCYPNPLAPHRYVLIYSGEYYGSRLPINHKHDLLPDFIVFRSDRFDYDGTDLWLCAGFFDSDWKLCPDTTWINEEALD